jgi:hypothetical protein
MHQRSNGVCKEASEQVVLESGEICRYAPLAGHHTEDNGKSACPGEGSRKIGNLYPTISEQKIESILKTGFYPGGTYGPRIKSRENSMGRMLTAAPTKTFSKISL